MVKKSFVTMKVDSTMKVEKKSRPKVRWKLKKKESIYLSSVGL